MDLNWMVEEEKDLRSKEGREKDWHRIERISGREGTMEVYLDMVFLFSYINPFGMIPVRCLLAFGFFLFAWPALGYFHGSAVHSNGGQVRLVICVERCCSKFLFSDT